MKSYNIYIIIAIFQENMRGLSGRDQAKISAMELHSPFDSSTPIHTIPLLYAVGVTRVPSRSQVEFLATGKAAESLERDCCDDILHVRGPQGNIYIYTYIYIWQIIVHLSCV